MSDIFHEVDEEVRRERLRQFWERYSLLIVGAAVLVVVAIAAWQINEYWMAKKAAAAGARFEAAVTLSEQGKHAEAESAFAKAAADAPDGYRILSRFRAAAEAAQVKPADAVKDYDALAADAALGSLWQELASLRAGMLLVDSAPLAELKKRLDPLVAPDRIYRHSARELLALSAWRNKDTAAAKHYLDMIANDADTPPGTRTRADVLSALIAANGKS